MFIQWLLGVCIGALVLSGCTPIAVPSAPMSATTPAATSRPTEAGCAPTPGQQITAPRLPDAALPAHLVLAGDSEPGERLVITGSVYAADCVTPLPNTVLEVWQANAAGEYTDLEGTLMTDADGRFQIDTIMPGMYGAPAHIHMRIYHPSAQAIETELVFAGDPNLPDTTAGFAVIPLARDEAAVDSGSHGVFDIVLTPSDDTGSASPAALGKADLWLQARPGGDSAHSHFPYRHRSDRSSQ